MRNSTTCLLVLMLAPVILADDTGKPVEKDKPAELSVAPLDHVTYPDTRPKWVGQSVRYDEAADTIVIVSGPCESPQESIEELELMQRAAVSTYISSLTESGLFDFYPISDEEIGRDLAVKTYNGEVTRGDSVLYEHAVELKFTQQKREQILTAWKNVEVRDRLGALGVLVLLGAVLLMCSSALLGLVTKRVERREQLQAA
ncbi:MAG: hypothetical protein AB8B91_07080 [Rubripirellula sp.]